MTVDTERESKIGLFGFPFLFFPVFNMPPEMTRRPSMKGAPLQSLFICGHEWKTAAEGGRMRFDQPGEEKLWDLSNILNGRRKKTKATSSCVWRLCYVPGCGVDSWRRFKLELTLGIDSQHGFSSIPQRWKLKLPPAWFNIWSERDGPLAWAPIDGRQSARGDNSPVSVLENRSSPGPGGGGKPSGREEGIRRQPVLKIPPPPPPGSLHQKTTIPQWVTLLTEPLQSSQNLLSQQTFEFRRKSKTKQGWNANVRICTPPPPPCSLRLSQSLICQTCK